MATATVVVVAAAAFCYYFAAVLLTLQTGRVHCSAFAGVSASFITPAFSVRSSSADGARTRRWYTTACLPVYVRDRTPIIQNHTVEPLVHEGEKSAGNRCITLARCDIIIAGVD